MVMLLPAKNVMMETTLMVMAAQRPAPLKRAGIALSMAAHAGLFVAIMLEPQLRNVMMVTITIMMVAAMTVRSRKAISVLNPLLLAPSQVLFIENLASNVMVLIVSSVNQLPFVLNVILANSWLLELDYVRMIALLLQLHTPIVAHKPAWLAQTFAQIVQVALCVPTALLQTLY